MKPRPIRIPDSLWSSLKDEAAERDLSTAAYVRRILRNRPDTQPDTDAVVDRLDELERRVDALEATPDTLPDTDSADPDTLPDTQPDTTGEYSEQNAAAIETLRDADGLLRKAEIVERVETAVGIPIKPDSWWTRHGRSAIRDAGAEQVGRRWKL